MTDKKPFLLIADSSKLSREVESFMIEKNIDYNILYSNKEDIPTLPLIFDNSTSFPFEGKIGFNLFKSFYKKSA